MKQAREACVARRDESNKLKRKLPVNEDKTKSPKITKDQNQPKMCKIQFQDNAAEDEDMEELDEEFADILPTDPEPTCSRALPMVSSNSSSTTKLMGGKSVKIKFRLDSCSDDEEENIDDDLQQKLCEIFGDPNTDDQTDDEESCSALSEATSSSSSNSCQFSIVQQTPSMKVMKIHYQEYHNRILSSEMKSLLHQSYLNDVEFVCKDGKVYANSLILGSMSNYLYNILADVPIVDKVKLVLMPEVSSVDLNVLFKLLFSNEAIKNVSLKDMKRIKTIATLFKLEQILVCTRKPGRPKGSLNKPKTSTTASVLSHPKPNTNIHEPLQSGKRTVFPSLKRQENNATLDHDKFDSECLEIFTSSAPSTSAASYHHQVLHRDIQDMQQGEDTPNLQQHMNLLPNNDLLDHIVQDTS